MKRLIWLTYSACSLSGALRERKNTWRNTNKGKRKRTKNDFKENPLEFSEVKRYECSLYDLVLIGQFKHQNIQSPTNVSKIIKFSWIVIFSTPCLSAEIGRYNLLLAYLVDAFNVYCNHYSPRCRQRICSTNKMCFRTHEWIDNYTVFLDEIENQRFS